MVRFVLLLLLSLTHLSIAHSQRVTMSDWPPALDTLTGEMAYVYVVDVPGVSATTLYDRARGWISEAFRSAKTVIDYEDRAGGAITAKPLITVRSGTGSVQGTSALWVAVDIRCKDNRFRLEIHPYESTTTTLTPPVVTPFSQYTRRLLDRTRQNKTVAKWQVDHVWAIDAHFKELADQVASAMKRPGKGEF